MDYWIAVLVTLMNLTLAIHRASKVKVVGFDRVDAFVWKWDATAGWSIAFMYAVSVPT